MSLRRLGLDRIGLYQLHRIDPKVPAANRSRSWSRCSVKARSATSACPRSPWPRSSRHARPPRSSAYRTPYSLTSRRAEPPLEYCQREGLAFIPWFPIGGGQLTRSAGVLQAVAAEHDATPAQVTLAWLLHRSPAMLPIPDTASVPHLEENVAAVALRLSDQQYQHLLGPAVHGGRERWSSTCGPEQTLPQPPRSSA